jgi:hypothetical protein
MFPLLYYSNTDEADAQPHMLHNKNQAIAQ